MSLFIYKSPCKIFISKYKVLHIVKKQSYQMMLMILIYCNILKADIEYMNDIPKELQESQYVAIFKLAVSKSHF